MPYPDSLKKSLEKHNIDETIIKQIYEGLLLYLLI
jgi:hypothetical protein